jgi:hypothetical protein
MEMRELEVGLHGLFDEMGITNPSWRVALTGREIIGKSDWSWLHIDIYKKYGKKPCQHRKLAYNFVRNVIDWERSIFYEP